MTRRDVRGLRAQVRRYARRTGCEEVVSLAQHREWLGRVDPTRLPPPTAAWIAEAYVVLTHEIATLRSEYRAAQNADHGAPALTRTVSGAALEQVLDVLQAVEEQPTDYGLPPGRAWLSRVTRLHDAWLGSVRVERYRLEFWGPSPLVERVFGIVQRELFP